MCIYIYNVYIIFICIHIFSIWDLGMMVVTHLHGNSRQKLRVIDL